MLYPAELRGLALLINRLGKTVRRGRLRFAMAVLWRPQFYPVLALPSSSLRVGE